MRDDVNPPEAFLPIDQLSEHETIVASEHALLPWVREALIRDKKALSLYGLKFYEAYSTRIYRAIKYCDEDIKVNHDEMRELMIVSTPKDWLHHELYRKGYIFHIDIQKDVAIAWINTKAKYYLHK
jgi:hypothetical protein